MSINDIVFRIVNAYIHNGLITNPTEQASSITIVIVIVNSHCQLNIVFRIANAYIHNGLITNPTEQAMTMTFDYDDGDNSSPWGGGEGSVETI